MSLSAGEANSVPRRSFLRSASSAAALSAAGALGYAWGIEPHWVETTRRDMPLAGLPSQWQGRTLLHLSDLHVGPADHDYLTAAVDAAAKLRPDLVVVTGDFLSYRRPEQFEEVSRLLARLGTPPHGLFGSFGNHDYGPDWSQVAVADALERRLSEVGFRLLRNAVHEMAGLRLAGLEDLWCPRFNLTAVRRTLADSTAGPTIALCHNPDVCDLPVWGDFRGWVLSGHTHGGQCRPPFLPAPIVPVQNRRYSSGAVPLRPGRTLYVSRGLGYAYRIRFNVRPEMTLFTLSAA